MSWSSRDPFVPSFSGRPLHSCTRACSHGHAGGRLRLANDAGGKRFPYAFRAHSLAPLEVTVLLSTLHRPLVIATLAGAIAVAGCGSSGNDNSSTPSSKPPTVTKDAKVAAEVPAAIKSKGTLTVAADASYP